MGASGYLTCLSRTLIDSQVARQKRSGVHLVGTPSPNCHPAIDNVDSRSLYFRTTRRTHMTKLKAIPGGKGKERTFALLYGLRLYPTGEIAEIQENEITLTNGTQGQVP